MNKYAELLGKAAERIDVAGVGPNEYEFADELRAAAAEMEKSEPVAWEVEYGDGWKHLVSRMDDAMCLVDNNPLHRVATPLYRHPTPVAPLVPDELTFMSDEVPYYENGDVDEKKFIDGRNACREAMLKVPSVAPAVPEKQNEDKSSRIEFEEYIVQKKLFTKYGAKLYKNVNGQYKDVRVNGHWQTWKAARK